MKNPIRTYLNWYGRNFVEISTESAGKAFMHYGTFAAKNIGIGLAVAAVVYGGIYAGCLIKEKLTKDEEA